MITLASPQRAIAALVLADGSVFWGRGIRRQGVSGGEVCFNTSMTGYQEIMTDPSYAGQIITFTFPHIGNVGANDDDNEAQAPFVKGLILRTDISSPSNYRAHESFADWLVKHGQTGICGVDTRALARHLRSTGGAQNGIICCAASRQEIDIENLKAQVLALPDMNGLDIAKTVSTKKSYTWSETGWNASEGAYGRITRPVARVVVIDYGIKRNILRCLASQGFDLAVVPCDTSAEEILALRPDGIFLSNGPGDPAATGEYAVPVIQKLLKSGLPLFGICLGHQMLAIALGGRTGRLPFGHRGANHPVKDIRTGRVEITSQNHGFHVLPDSLPDTVEATHISLFDGTNEGLRVKGRPVFSIQYHPEASPGPQDSHYLFGIFAEFIQDRQRKIA